MKTTRLICSLLVGFAFALLTWLIFGNHIHLHHVGAGLEYLGWVITIVSLPGLFTGVAVSGNIHGGGIGLAVLGNFLFYFVATYIILTIWERRKARIRRLLQTSQDGPS
jgi:hypothetical protein